MGRLSVPLLILMLALSIGACNRANDSAAAAGLHVTLVPAAEGVQGDHLIVKIDRRRGPAGHRCDGEPGRQHDPRRHGSCAHRKRLGRRRRRRRWHYVVPFGFTMLGDWIITAKIEQRDGEPLSEAFDVTATNSAIP